MNPEMMKLVAEARMSEMRAAASRSGRTRHPSSRHSVGGGPMPPQVASNGPGAARRSVGWFLVSVGMRLAVSGKHPVSAA